MAEGLNIIAVGFMALTAGLAGLNWPDRPAALAAPETIQLPGGVQSYRPAGEFRKGTRIVDAPLESHEVSAVVVMKYHVSEADYARCVGEKACPAAPSAGRPNYPQTNISYADALAYAAWFSDHSGLDWRLPTDAEWLRAAGDRGIDDALAPGANSADPSRRWIATYRREVTLRGVADLDLHPMGYFGANDMGVADVAGNIWEWTDTCFQNGTLTADASAIATRSDYCGVRAVQGKHRAFVIDFIRDARSSGCSAGIPPDYLGFRLVRAAS